MATKEKINYTAAERKALTEALKLTDECCFTCEHGRKKDKGQKYACTIGKGNKYPFECCERDYKRNQYLEGMGK